MTASQLLANLANKKVQLKSFGVTQTHNKKFPVMVVSPTGVKIFLSKEFIADPEGRVGNVRHIRFYPDGRERGNRGTMIRQRGGSR